MRSSALATALAAILLMTVGSGVFAQGRSGGEGFDRPWQGSMEESEEQPPETETPVDEAVPDVKVVLKGPRSSGAVALTFDDGYNARACRSIARTLRKYDAVGTFFINGQWLKKEPERWRRILKGMEVANHTRSHPDLRGEPHPVVINQIRSNEYIHESVLGRPLLKAIRPPYGSYGDRIGRIAAKLGYEHVVMWNVDTGDWKRKASPKRIVRAATGAPAGSIILMHCARDATAKALPRIVRHYQRRGLEVAGLSEVLEGARDQRRTADSERYGS